MNDGPRISDTIRAYPYDNFSPYSQMPFGMMPPPPPKKRFPPLKIFLTVVFMLVLMALSGLSGYLMHGMGNTS